MKNLKFAVLAFGVLGLIAYFIPQHGFKMFDAKDGPDGKLIVFGGMAGFAIAAVAGIMGATKPPFGKPQAGIGLLGFVIALILGTGLKPHKVFDGFSAPFIGAKLIVVAILGGLVVSILALVKSEEA